MSKNAQIKISIGTAQKKKRWNEREYRNNQYSQSGKKIKIELGKASHGNGGWQIEQTHDWMDIVMQKKKKK